jgi:S1-C subfamily serine protease
MNDSESIALGIMLILVGIPATFLILHSRSERKERELKKQKLEEELTVVAGEPVSTKVLIQLGDMSRDDGKIAEAVEYYQAAADLNSASACKKLSSIYRERFQADKAFNYELKAAEFGDESSMRLVSQWYKSGHGTLKNIGKSTYWLLRSAETGNGVSMVRVAEAYISGFGVQENPMEGLAWLYVSEHKGSHEAAGLIKNAETKLNNALILLAQDRAKALLDLIKEGHRTAAGSFGDTPGSSAPGQSIGSKPKHSAKGSGSGAVISPAGHIVTAAHVIKGATYLEIVTPAGTFPAKVLNNDEQNDVALLKVDQAFDSHIRVGRSSDVRLGQSVATIGFPNIGIQGHSPKVTQGMISSDNGVQNDIRMWQISVPIQPGNSGGPLLDEHGKLIGVVVASLSLRAIQMTGSVPQNVNYAIKGAYLEPLMSFNKLAPDSTAVSTPASFQDMIAIAQKSSVLILVY